MLTKLQEILDAEYITESEEFNELREIEGKDFNPVEICEYDEQGRITYRKFKRVGFEQWFEWFNNTLFMKDSDGGRMIYEFDNNGNILYTKNMNGYVADAIVTETWRTYDEHNRLIKEKIESRWLEEPADDYDDYIHACSIEHVYEYDDNGKIIKSYLVNE